MRCSCRACGTYMVQEEYGLYSGCKCPACGSMCRDCLGSTQEALSPEQIRDLFAHYIIPDDAIKVGDEEDEYPQDDEALKSPRNWRKYL